MVLDHPPAATNRRAIQDLQSGKEAAGIPSGVGRPIPGSVIPGRRRASTAGSMPETMANSQCERMGGTLIHFVNVSPGGSTRAANNSVADPVDSSTLPLDARDWGPRQNPRSSATLSHATCKDGALPIWKSAVLIAGEGTECWRIF